MFDFLFLKGVGATADIIRSIALIKATRLSFHYAAHQIAEQRVVIFLSDLRKLILWHLAAATYFKLNIVRAHRLENKIYFFISNEIQFGRTKICHINKTIFPPTDISAQFICQSPIFHFESVIQIVIARK